METVEGQLKDEKPNKKNKVKIDISLVRWAIGIIIAICSINPEENKVDWLYWILGVVIATCIKGSIKFKNYKIKF